MLFVMMFAIVGIANATVIVTETSLLNQINQTYQQQWFRSTDNINLWCNATNDVGGQNISYIWNIYQNGNPFLNGVAVDGITYNFSSFETDLDGWTNTSFIRSNEWGYDGSWSMKFNDGSGITAILYKPFNFTNNVKLAINISANSRCIETCAGIPNQAYSSLYIYNGDELLWSCGGGNACPMGLTYLDLNTTTIKTNITIIEGRGACSRGFVKPCPVFSYSNMVGYVDSINVSNGLGYPSGTRVNFNNINSSTIGTGNNISGSCYSCAIDGICSSTNTTSLYTIYDVEYTNISELFETGTQIFNLNFNGTYPSLAQWVMINNPYMFYEAHKDEPPYITNYTNFVVFAGDNNNNQTWATSFLITGKTGRADGIRWDMYNRVGTPETQNMIYNVTICNTTVLDLTANASYGADCNETPVVVRSNANFSQIFDGYGTGTTANLNFTTPYNMTNGTKYILNLIPVSQLNNSANDFWRVKAETIGATGYTNYRRTIGGTPTTFDLVVDIDVYTNGVPTDTNSLAWENMTQGILGQWSITKLIPDVNADTPMTYLYRWNDTIAERIIPVNTTIKNFQIGLNGSISILNVTFYDELNQSDISPNMTTTSIWKVTFPTGATQTFSLNTTGAFTINMTPSTAVVQADVEFIYIKNGYRQRTYYLTNATLSGASITQLRLADIVANDTISSPITFTLKNYNTDILPNYYIDIQRWYVDQNGYSTIAIAKTDVQAKAVVWLQPYLAFYRILVYDNANNIVYTASRQVISQSDIEIQLQDSMDSNTYEKYSSIQYTFVKNRTLGIVRADLTDTTGSTFTAVMNVNRLGIFGSTTVCNATGGGSATSLICSAPINTSDEYIITVDVTKGGTTFPLISDNLNYKSGEYGLDGIVSAFLIIGTLAFMGLGSPHMAILTTLLGIGISVALGLLVTGVASFVGLIIVGIAMLMVMRR